MKKPDFKLGALERYDPNLRPYAEQLDRMKCPHLPCKYCGMPTSMSTQQCDGCWEVTHRLRGFLRGGPRAILFAARALYDTVQESHQRAKLKGLVARFVTDDTADEWGGD